jgi:hypothetical protein
MTSFWIQAGRPWEGQQKAPNSTKQDDIEQRSSSLEEGGLRTLGAVREDDELEAALDGGTGLVTDALQGGLQAAHALGDRPCGVNDLGGPAAQVHGLEGLHLRRPQDRLHQLQPAGHTSAASARDTKPVKQMSEERNLINA